MNQREQELLIIAGGLIARNVQQNQQEQLRLAQKALEEQRWQNALLLEKLKTPEERAAEEREQHEAELRFQREQQEAEIRRQRELQAQAEVQERQRYYKIQNRRYDEAVTGGVTFMYCFCAVILGVLGFLLWMVLHK
jgi:hypothetical protein